MAILFFLDNLEKELEKTKKRGYAIALQDTSLGWANYAVPIFSGKHIEASIGVSFPYNFLKEKELVKSMVSRLLKITKEASHINPTELFPR
jgi:DNA-binding IclR family transcriptional regulator